MNYDDMNCEILVNETWDEKFGNYCIAAFTRERVFAFMGAVVLTVLALMIFLWGNWLHEQNLLLRSRTILFGFLMAINMINLIGRK